MSICLLCTHLSQDKANGIKDVKLGIIGEQRVPRNKAFNAMSNVGILQVSVVEGKKLVTKDASGCLDSYVTLKLDNERVQ